MKIEDYLELYKDVDNILEGKTVMKEPNASIKIHEGSFILKTDENIEFNIEGEIKYEWFPTTGVIFNGKPTIQSLDIFRELNNSKFVTLYLETLPIGIGYISNTHLGNDVFIKGQMRNEALIGDFSIPVEKIKFSIPNFYDFLGISVKRITDDNISLQKGRMILENEKYVIKLDKVYDYKELNTALEEKGGYVTVINGEISAKKGALVYQDLNDVFHCLNLFLTFFNGRRTSAIFRHGIFNGDIIWSDYSNYHIDIYKFTPRWPQKHSIEGISDMWRNFSNLWNNSNGKGFLQTAIHWYIEANKGSGFTEGAIIMAQTALELIYNWYIVERKKLILGKDSENINAANKIRLLLSQLNIDCSKAPAKFSELNEFINNPKLNILDAVDAVVQIRNAIVHSQEEKRKRLDEINTSAKYQSLQLCIWYIEMSLLKILDFDGYYLNRCSEQLYTSARKELVPWSLIHPI